MSSNVQAATRRKLILLWAVALVTALVAGPILSNGLARSEDETTVEPSTTIVESTTDDTTTDDTTTDDTTTDDTTVAATDDGATVTAAAAPIDKGYAYTFVFEHTDGSQSTVVGTSDSNVAFVADVGGSAIPGTGMNVHVSCSDAFPNGWGEKDGPVDGVDTEWRVASYSIDKYDNGSIKSTCSDTINLSASTAAAPAPNGTDVDYSEYTFEFTDGTIITGSNQFGQAGWTGDKNQAEIGLSESIHVSCSDGFKLDDDDPAKNGWGEKGAPVNGVDPSPLLSYTITKYKDGVVDKVCNDTSILGPPADPPPGLADITISLQKLVSVDGGPFVDADAPTGPSTQLGSPVRFRFDVMNTGEVSLSNFNLTDSDFSTAGCVLPPTLAPGASGSCEIGPFDATFGQHANTGVIVAQAADEPHVYDGNKNHWSFFFADGTVITGSSSGDAEIGLSDTVHMSCSDDFGFDDDDPTNDGWGQSGAPEQGVDPQPLIAFSITKFKSDGTVDKTCGPDTSDSDPAHYFGEGVAAPQPDIDIEKLVSVNGGAFVDADAPTGPTAKVGQDVRFRFIVTNTGDVTLSGITLTDTDFSTSSCSIPATLAPNASFTCNIGPFTAVLGQHNDVATVNARPGTTGGYNGDAYAYTFVLASGQVLQGTADNNEAEVGLSDKIHISCSDEFGFTDDDPANDGWGEKGAPVQGVDPAPVLWYNITKFRSDGTIDKTCGVTLTDSDPAHYIGVPPQPAIALEKYVSVDGQQTWHEADTPTGPMAIQGENVYFRFKVTNTGETVLTNLKLTDTDFTVPTSGIPSSLAIGASYQVIIGPFPAQLDQHSNTGTATGVGGAAQGHQYNGTPGHTFTFLLANGDVIEGISGPNSAEVGLSQTIHVSCSDDFGFEDNDPSNDGWGEKGAPVQGVDPSPIVSYKITKFKSDGTIEKTCGEGDPFTGQTVTATDPAHYIGKRLSALGDYVWFDTDQDGIQDANEIGIDGVTVRLIDATTGGVLRTTTTANGGLYRFSDLFPGDYRVLVVPPSSFMISPRDAGADDVDSDINPTTGVTVTITLDPGEVDLTWDAGLYPATPSIDIEKYTNGNDADNEGDPDVPFIAQGGAVTWTYVVTNTGNTPLTNVRVIDDEVGLISCPANVLAIGADMTCTATGVALDVPYDNLGTATGVGPFGTVVRDDDPSHYVGYRTGIHIRKLVNSFDANDPTGPFYEAGTLIRFGFIVTNQGNVPLTDVVVTDDVFGDICTIGDLGLGSQSIATCYLDDLAVEGQHANTATVVGQPTTPAGDPLGGTITDDDPAHYFGWSASIDIEKATNGEDADTGPGPHIPVGDPVEWTYVVTNTGNTTLADVLVSDDEIGDICTIATLAPNASDTCTANGSATLGEYDNLGTAAGFPVDNGGKRLTATPVTDDDPSHYTGYIADIKLKKFVNGDDAEDPTGPEFLVGDTVRFTFIVTNTGSVDLLDVVLVDDVFGAVCDFARLPAFGPGSTEVCVIDVPAVAGQHRNEATAIGQPVDATDNPLGGPIDDSDLGHYIAFAPGIDIEKATNGEDADDPTGPTVIEGDTVTWTYVVTNPGPLSASDVIVTDSDGGVTPVFSGGDANNDGLLNPGETWLYEATGTATVGQYENIGTVTGDAVTDNGLVIGPVSDTDPSHYLGKGRTRLGNFVWEDLDADGIQDDLEPGIANVEVKLIDATDGSVVDTTSTDADGEYYFEMVPAGFYRIMVTPPAGLVITTPNVPGDDAKDSDIDGAGTTEIIVVPVGLDEDLTWDAGLYSVARLGNFVWFDDDVNGLQDGGDVGVPDITVRLLDASMNDTGSTQTTNDRGEFWFEGLRPGTYFLQFELPDQYSFTTPNVTTGTEESDSDAIPQSNPKFGKTVAITLESGQEDGTWDAGVIRLSPAIDISKNIEGDDTTAAAVRGTDVIFTIRVENTGELDLIDVVITDVETPDCDTTFASLTVGQVETYECTAQNVQHNGDPLDPPLFRNVVEVTGTAAATSETVSDSDPTNVPLLAPDIEIIKYTKVVPEDPDAVDPVLGLPTNPGFDANVAPGPYVDDTDFVRWFYVVTNTGQTDLFGIDVTDDQLVPSLVCTLPGSLAPGDSFYCVTPTAPVQPGQYANIGTATGASESGETVTDDDPSHYFGVGAFIDIEKSTNGEDADLPQDAAFVRAGQPVVWEYVVTNNSNVPLTSIIVTDSKGVAVSCPTDTLAVGDFMTCTGTGVAIAGPYENIGDVVAVPADPITGDPLGLDPVRDLDPSHYFGVNAVIDIEKATNGEDADTPTGPLVPVGDDVTWTYVVTNGGNVPLATVVVTDNQGVTPVFVGGDANNNLFLDPGEIWTYEATGTAVAGQYNNLGTVTGTPPVGGDVTDDDPSHYFGAAPSLTIEKATNGQDADSASDPDVPQVLPGDPVEWTYVVTNTGNVPITDVVVTDDQIDVVAGPLSGDVDNDGVLGVGEVWTYVASGFAADLRSTQFTTVLGACAFELGDVFPTYENKGVASGDTVVGPIEVFDWSHYCNPPVASWTLDKLTNGAQADGASDADVPQVLPGDPVEWKYIVTNTGEVPVTGVVVTDDQIDVVAGPLSGDVDNDGVLGVGEVWTYVASGFAADLRSTQFTTVLGACAFELGDVFPTYENKGVASGDTVVGPIEVFDWSHYCNPPVASWTLDKLTNGAQADGASDADVPQVLPGDPVEWKYIVTNTGEVPVTGVVVTDDQIDVVAGPLSGDVDNDGVLGVGEVWTYVASGFAADLRSTQFTTVLGACAFELGDVFPTYENKGVASGDTVVGPIEVFDWSHYCNPPVASWTLDKLTNGAQADGASDADVPQVLPGDPVEWKYIVTNTGEVPVTGVVVTDDQIDVVAGPLSGDVDNDGVLGVGEVWTYVASGFAADLRSTQFTTVLGACSFELGDVFPTYENKGVASGDTVVGPIEVFDWSHYCNPPLVDVDIEKATNGDDADLPTGPFLLVGAPVTWTYRVTNTGELPLVDIVVTDDQIPGLVCAIATPLLPGESDSCEASGTAAAGQYANNSMVVGTAVDARTANDEDPSHYFGAEPSILILKDPDTQTVLEGGTATFDITVRNTGNTTLVDVEVTDALAPNCDRTSADIAGLGSMAPLAEVTYTCDLDGIVDDLTNVAAVVGTPVDSDGNPFTTDVTDDDPADVIVINKVKIGDLVWHDLDADGIQDGEPGIGQVPVTVFRAADDTIAAQTATDGDGLWMASVFPGDYYVVFGDAGGIFSPQGQTTTDLDSNPDASGRTPSFTVIEDQDDPTIDAGIYYPARLGDLVWLDTDRNGVQEGGDAGAPNVTVRLLDAAMNPTGAPVVTDATGAYEFTGLVPGTYYVQFELPSWYSFTTPNVPGDEAADSDAVPQLDAKIGKTAVITLLSGDNDPDWDAGVIPLRPAIDISKNAEGPDTTTPIPLGGTATFQIRVENTGELDLHNVVVTDLLAPNCAADASTEPGLLVMNPGDVVTYSCTLANITAEITNVAVATGTATTGPGVQTPVTDSDPSTVPVLAPNVDIEKATNGDDADVPTGPFVAVGSTVTWTYRVVNTGGSPLMNVSVTDDKGVTPLFVSGDTNNDGFLDVGEIWIYEAEGIAAAGQYANVGTVNAENTAGTPVTDSDPSHYFGAAPSIDIEKATNGDDADLPTGPLVAAGLPVVWTYVVTNIGNTELGAPNVTDDQGATPVFKSGDNGNNVLEVGEAWVYEAIGTAVAGQYENLGSVSATPLDSNGLPYGAPSVTDEDPSHYFGAAPAIDISKNVEGDDTTASAVRGTDVTFTITVENTGNVDLVDVVITDTETPSCATTFASLTVGQVETYQCTAINVQDNGGILEPPSFRNVVDVTANAVVTGQTVTDSDPTTVPLLAPSIEIVKYTRVVQNDPDAVDPVPGLPTNPGFDANTPPGPYVDDDDFVRWTYVVTNNGETELFGIDVTDDQLTPSLVCSFPGPLAVGDSFYCVTPNATVQLGQYANIGTATGASESGETVTDDDPSHYFGVGAFITIEKSTNGVDADLPADAVLLEVGADILWEYVVTNNSNLPLTLVTVTDSKGVSLTCPKDTLAVGESMTCSADGVAVAGPYENIGSVVAVPADPATGLPLGLDPVSDADPSHYFGVDARIDIEKATNGVDADLPADAAVVAVGAQVTWTYVITNPGNVPLAAVTVIDDQGVIPTFVGGDANTNGFLDPGETWTYEGTGTAIEGPYANLGTVTGIPPFGPPVTDDDPSHYLGMPASIDIEKFTNNVQADAPADAVVILVGEPVSWTYVVTNTGDMALTNVTVTDDQGVTVTCPATELAVGADMTCTASGTATIGLYANIGTVVGTPPSGATVTDSDPSHYFGADPSIEIEKATNGVDADDPASGPQVAPGDLVTWTYVVTNTGNVPVADVTVTDSVLGPVAGPVSGDTNNDGLLDLGETWLYEASGLAGVLSAGGPGVDPAGTCGVEQRSPWPVYGNKGEVAGSFLGDPVPVASDLSHYCNPPQPSIDVEKATNGVDGDSADDAAAQVAPGDTVTWTYVVTNTGDVPVANVTVVDSVLGTILGPDSGDTNNDGLLDLTETWTYSTSATAPDFVVDPANTVVGTCGISQQFVWPVYENQAVASGDYLLSPVTDDDWSHYCNPPAPSIDIEKATNGVDADDPADAPIVLAGDPVAWTYVVTNTGNTVLAGVGVVDDQGVAVTCPQSVLLPGEAMTCTASGIAVANLYANIGTATGTPPVGVDVTHEDPSHYFGVDARIAIEKSTNGEDADTPTGPFVPVTDPVSWLYKVTNTGNVPLTGVVVLDDQSVSVSCPATDLAPGASMDCTASGSATAGQYANLGSAFGTPPIGPIVGDEDPSHYFGSDPAIEIVKTTITQQPILEGESVTFEIVVTNTGNVTLTNVTVADPLAPSCDRTSLDIAGLATMIPSASETYQCTLDNVLASFTNVATTTGTPPVGPPVDDDDDAPVVVIPLVDIGDRLWHDLNGDGIQDSGEPGLEDYTVELFTTGDVSQGTETTGPNGIYTFVDVPAGDYYMVFTKPNGSVFTKQFAGADDVDSNVDAVGRSDDFTVVATDIFTIDAGVYFPARIGDFVWEDLNGNGLYDPGEPPLVDVFIELLDKDGNAIDDTFSDGVGFYEFIDLAPGTYSVRFGPVQGLVFTIRDQVPDTRDSDANPFTGESHQVTLASTDNDPTIDAGYVQFVTVGDYVWIDSDGDGTQNETGTGVGNVTVRLVSLDTGAIRVTMTAPDGSYSFANVAPGEYLIEVDAPAGTRFTGIDLGGDDALDSDVDAAGTSAPFQVVSGQDDLTRDAGLKSIDLEITKFAIPEAVIAGTAFQYQILVENISDVDATGVVLLDLLPARSVGDPPFVGLFEQFPQFDETSNGVGDSFFQIDNPDLGLGFLGSERNPDQGATLDGALPAGCAYDAAVHGIRCEIGDLAAGADVTYTFNVFMDSGALIRVWNRAFVYADQTIAGFETNIDKADPTSLCGSTGPAPGTIRVSNNEGVGCNWVKKNATAVVNFDLTIDKTDSKDPVDPGETFSYKIDVVNNGPSLARDVWIVDTLPAEFSFVSGPVNCAHAAGVIECSFGDMDAATAKSLTITVKASDTAIGTFTNVVRVDSRWQPPAGLSYVETDLTNNVADEPTTVAVTARLGDTVWLDTNGNGIQDAGETGVGGVTINVTGAATGSAVTTAGAYMVDSLPAGTYVVTVDPSTIPAGHKLTTAGSHNVTLTGGQTYLDADFGIKPVMIDLEVTKVASAVAVSVGDSISFTVTVINKGPDAATGVVLTDTPDAAFTVLSTSGDGSYDKATNTWTIGNLGVGESRTLVMNVSVDVIGTHSNSVEVTAANETDIDSVPADGKGDDFAVAGVSASAVLAETVENVEETLPRTGIDSAALAGIALLLLAGGAAALIATRRREDDAS